MGPMAFLNTVQGYNTVASSPTKSTKPNLAALCVVIYWDNGKGNGNYYKGLYWGYIGVILGLYWGYIGFNGWIILNFLPLHL